MKKNNFYGFTLIELLIVLSLLSVLLVLAAPSFKDFQRSSQITSTTNTLVAALYTARNEAIKNNSHSYLVPMNGSKWESGWQIFIDKNFDQTNNNGDLTILESDALPEFIKIKATGSANESPPYVRFDGSGYPQSKNGAPASFTISIEPDGSSSVTDTRNIKVAKTGRIRSCRPKSTNDNDCKSTSTD